MAVPSIVDDGDFSEPMQNGGDEYTMPFYAKGDDVSWEITRKMRVASEYYVRPKLMQKVKTRFGNAYRVDMTDPSESGNSLVEWTETLASLPVKRIEGSTIVWALQFLDSATPEVAEIPMTLTAEFEYEYFLTQPEPIIAPKVAIIAGQIAIFNNWGTFYGGQRIAAEDSDVGIYKGRIYYRKTPYIRYPRFTNRTP